MEHRKNLWENVPTGTRTDGENVHEKSSTRQGRLNGIHRIPRCRIKLIVLGLGIHPVRNRQGQRSSQTFRPISVR